MTKDEALKLALEALESKYIVNCGAWRVQQDQAITAIKEALAQPEQEPVAKKKHEPKIDLGKYAGTYGGYTTPEPSEGYLQKAYRLANELRSHLSIAPAQRTWVSLTDEEIDKAWRSCDYTVPWEQHRIDIARAIEAKLKEKNA